jgi:hypothetical protein
VGVSIMDVEESFDTEHLLLTERKCRVCGEIKDLITDFYKIRKKRYDLISSYSYECKFCTVKRISGNIVHATFPLWKEVKI